MNKEFEHETGIFVRKDYMIENLIEIRTILDFDIPRGKQFITNLIKEIKR